MSTAIGRRWLSKGLEIPADCDRPTDVSGTPAHQSNDRRCVPVQAGSVHVTVTGLRVPFGSIISMAFAYIFLIHFYCTRESVMLVTRINIASLPRFDLAPARFWPPLGDRSWATLAIVASSTGSPGCATGSTRPIHHEVDFWPGERQSDAKPQGSQPASVVAAITPHISGFIRYGIPRASLRTRLTWTGVVLDV